MSKNELYAQSGVAMTCRSFEEYKEMFMLEQDILGNGAVLDVAAGASSFTAELQQRGYKTVAVDPLYKLSPGEISQLGGEEIIIASQKLSKNENLFVWNNYHSVDHHDEIRKNSLAQFLESYKLDQNKETYIAAALPSLPFVDDTFSLVFCNHFLFLYQEQFDFTFHIKAIQEMLRVTQKGGSICIYPLVGFKDEIYPYLDKFIQTITKKGFHAKLTETNFRFLPSATHFLQIEK